MKKKRKKNKKRIKREVVALAEGKCVWSPS